MSDADIGRANYADMDEMADFGISRAAELAALDRAAAFDRAARLANLAREAGLSTEAPWKQAGL